MTIPFFRKKQKSEPETFVTYEIINKEKYKGIKCLDCGLTSWNENDVRHKYCGNCHQFHEIKMMRKRLDLPLEDETFEDWWKRKHPVIAFIGRFETPLVYIGAALLAFQPIWIKLTTPTSLWDLPLRFWAGATIGFLVATWQWRRREQREKQLDEKRKKEIEQAEKGTSYERNN